MFLCAEDAGAKTRGFSFQIRKENFVRGRILTISPVCRIKYGISCTAKNKGFFSTGITDVYYVPFTPVEAWCSQFSHSATLLLVIMAMQEAIEYHFRLRSGDHDAVNNPTTRMARLVELVSFVRLTSS